MNSEKISLVLTNRIVLEPFVFTAYHHQHYDITMFSSHSLMVLTSGPIACFINDSSVMHTCFYITHVSTL